MRNNRLLLALAVRGALAFGVAACGDDDERPRPAAPPRRRPPAGGELSGKIAIDGSSTVAPFAEAAAELFNEENPDVQITVGTSGTGGGFEKFCAGETDISDASRPIKDDEEVPVCEKNGVTYTEVQVANDGIAVATNKDLAVDCLHRRTSSSRSGTRARRSSRSPRSTRASPTPSSRSTARAPTPARSTSSPTRSTARRA